MFHNLSSGVNLPVQVQSGWGGFAGNYAPVSTAFAYRFQPTVSNANLSYFQPMTTAYNANASMGSGILNQTGQLGWNPNLNTGQLSWNPNLNTGQLSWNPNLNTGQLSWNPNLNYVQSFAAPTNNAFAGGNLSTGMANNIARTSFGISQPAIDISETKNDIVLACDLPNVNLNDLNLSVTDNSCTISAQSFLGGQAIALHRTVPLPTSVRAEAVDANYSNGILSVRMTKKDTTARKQIQVNMS